MIDFFPDAGLLRKRINFEKGAYLESIGNRD